MIGGGYSASASDTTNQTASQKQDLGSSGSSGYRSSIINNYASGGSKLDAAVAATGDGLPVWAWVGLIGGLGLLFYLMLRRHK